MGIFDYFHKENVIQEANVKNDLKKNQENVEYRAKNKDLDMIDSYIAESGRLIIEKDMASIGVIQRAFKIGFNRAARIMDMLEDMGVVGEETGTRPRKILVTIEEYEKIVEKYCPKNINSNTENSQQVQQTYMTLEEIEVTMKESFGVEANYSKDGIVLRNMKNIIVPSVSNEIQMECINVLLKYNSPVTMKLILIDDSIITYSGYNGVPQLLIPVITEAKKIDGAVHWCLSEMQERIRKFVKYGVKNIDSYNERIKSLGESTLPKIIIIANESNEFFPRVSSPLERMFMNCNMVGMYFILFSRFSLKSLPLGMVGELLEVYTADKLRILLSQSATTNNSQNITRNFDDMDGHQFERFCSDILRKNGFENVEVTQGSGDHGIDILAEKEDITYAIQCKCYSSDIGNAAVQQAHTGKSIYHKDIAVVLTNRYFTAQAKEEAAALGVKLWDRDKLNSMIEKANS